MRFITAKITRDTNHSVSTDHAPWELPILEALYEPGNVEVTGEKVIADRELPDAGEEFQRLASRYGVNTETGVTIVEEVFGRGGQGRKALADLIEAEKKHATPKKRAAKAGADKDELAA